MNRFPTIVSLVPSWTETIVYLGGRTQLIGRTKFCIHPEDVVKGIPKVGGTKNIHTDQIIELAPELVIANKEENIKEQIETLIQAGINVWLSECSTMEKAVHEIVALGRLINRDSESKALARDIKEGCSRKDYPRYKVCYLIWKDPLMTVGKDTYINNVLAALNLENIFNNETRYPETSIAAIKKRNPDHILLSSEPYPFKEVHRMELEQSLGIPCHIVDGEVFGWYGSKMLSIPKYGKFLHNELYRHE